MNVKILSEFVLRRLGLPDVGPIHPSTVDIGLLARALAAALSGPGDVAAARIANGFARSLPALVHRTLNDPPRRSSFNPAATSATRRLRRGESWMAVRTSVGRDDDLAAIEAGLKELVRRIGTAASPDTGRITEFEARIVSTWTDYLFKEQWSGIAIAPGLSAAARSRVVASGHKSWTALSDTAFPVSMPALLSLQRKAAVVPDQNRGEMLSPIDTRRYVVDRAGVLGADTGHWRCLVEFDPDAEVAPVLNTGTDRRAAFIDLFGRYLAELEIGAHGLRRAEQDIGHKRTVLEFLYELHTNGWEHARGRPGIRAVRVEKHLYAGRHQLTEKAASFGELEAFIGRQNSRGRVNMIEASVSDFGPGILDGFLASMAGRRYANEDRGALLDRLVREKLSAKIGDPNAGLGMPYALEAARSIYGFVSLRTGEFWLTMDGSAGDPGPTLLRRPGTFPPVQGTHWQLLYPDMIR